MTDAPLPGMPDTPPETPVALSQGEAARACGVSQATLRRARRSGRLPGATQSDDGGWRIPVSDLLGAGFSMDRVTPDTTGDGGHDTAQEGGAALEIADLRRMLSESERARAVAEALATERAREIERADRMLRLLEARPAPPPAPETTPAPAPTPPPTDAPTATQPPQPRSLRERWRARWGK